MAAQSNRAVTVCRILLWLCLLLPMPGSQALGQQPRRRPVAAPVAAAPVSLAVLPFRNAFARQSSGNDDVSILGDGLADSLTNALKSAQGLTVIDSEIVLRAAARFPGAEITAQDKDALELANALGVQVVLAGSFQLRANHLHVDARLLTASP